MLNVLMVVWRESFEGFLIIGILTAFLKRQQQDSKSPLNRRAQKFMWAGIAAGASMAIALGFALHAASTQLQGEALEIFQTSLLFVAAILMTQMCLWMSKHSRTIKKDLESGLSTAISDSNLWSVAGLSALAIAREGAETVVFLYGMGIEVASQGQIHIFLATALVGFILAGFTAWLFALGLSRTSQKWFFKITTVFLLLTAGSLLLNGVRRLIQSDILPTLQEHVWDTSAVLDERSPVGHVVFLITGYESSPNLTLVLFYALFWISYFFIYRLFVGDLKPQVRV